VVTKEDREGEAGAVSTGGTGQRATHTDKTVLANLGDTREHKRLRNWDQPQPAGGGSKDHTGHLEGGETSTEKAQGTDSTTS